MNKALCMESATYFRDRILDLFNVDIPSGEITRKTSRGGRPPGEIAGTIRVDGYRQLSIDGKHYLAHQLLVFLKSGYFPEEVDHLNGIKDDNRDCNLRPCNRDLNAKNKKMSSANKHGATGIRYRISRDAFEAYWVDLNNIKKCLYFSCKKYGHEEAKRLAVKHRKESIANLNKLGAGYTDRHGL